MYGQENITYFSPVKQKFDHRNPTLKIVRVSCRVVTYNKFHVRERERDRNTSEKFKIEMFPPFSNFTPNMVM